ncbi:MAG: DUF1684 domain-containing protein [Ignavibacteriales bacterium]|nr:DUF1684 domain-containing protein [Ignavibacteriales bacterium]
MRRKINIDGTQMTLIRLIYTDKSASIRFFCVISVLFLILSLISCGKNYTTEQKAYIKKIEKYRTEKNKEMKNNPSSPFNKKGKVEFHDLNYFDVDPSFIFRSMLYEFNPKDTVTIYGTKGEPRKTIRFGYVVITYQNKQYKINVYQGTTAGGETYYSIWFTDKTTNNESYGVGRYIDFQKVDDPDNEYETDFNLAYNPYCAYSPNYSCAIPTKEDFIPISIRAGEKKFHD